MKMRATSCFYWGLALCLCLVFSAFVVQCQPTFGGITAQSSINLIGNSVTMNSFNSADPNHSIWQTGMTWHGLPYGVYSNSLSYSSNSLPSITSDFTVATDGSIINVGNANIYGYVDTAPGGFASVNAYGSVGDLDWVYDGTSGIESGHAEDNMNQVFYSKNLPNPAANGWQLTWLPVPPILRPNTYFKIGGTWTNVAGIGWTNVGGTLYQASISGTAVLPAPGATAGTTATYSMVITNMVQNTNWVFYDISQLSGNIFVDAPNVVLYCTNGISLSGARTITINTNADLTIYTTGNVSVTGNGYINNGANYARALSIYDVAGHTNIVFSFSGSFAPGPAIIYTPSSLVSFSGGGPSSYDFVGAIFCNSLTVNGHYNFHYDESLANGPFPVPPAIIQQPTNEIVQAGSNATFSVVAGGSPTAYQWYFNQSYSSQITVSNAIDGATSPSLTITNAQLSDDGFYFVELSYTNGSVSSSPVWLAVYTNAAATLSGSLNAANGQFDLIVQNVGNHVAGMPYILQASTNLTDWVPILTNTSAFMYTETNAYDQRYYRAVFIGH